MIANLTIGIIREGKVPQDNRVPLTPRQCKELLEKYPGLRILVQPSPHRCFTDREYTDGGIMVQEDLSDCQVLFGVKEVPVEDLLSHKTYFFFSHTIKAQSYNRTLLQQVLEKHIRLVDYECLTWENGIRILGFGRFAGIVGAHNGLLAYGKKTGTFELKPAHQRPDFEAVKADYGQTQLPPFKIVVTGTGRVARGAAEVLDLLNIEKVSPDNYLSGSFDHAVYTMLDIPDMYIHRQTGDRQHQGFFDHPEDYDSLFQPYTTTTDLMINAVYWDPAAPVFFTKADMQKSDFRIKTIADITCDIEGSIPATHRATIIEEPVFGYDPLTGLETAPYQRQSIDIMAVDNLPNELPKDASESFGRELIEHIFPEMDKATSTILESATIAHDGALMPAFNYLSAFVLEST